MTTLLKTKNKLTYFSFCELRRHLHQELRIGGRLHRRLQAPRRLHQRALALQLLRHVHESARGRPVPERAGADHGRGRLRRGPAQDPAAGREHALLPRQAHQDGLHCLRQHGLAGRACHALHAEQDRVSLWVTFGPAIGIRAVDFTLL